MNDVDMEMLKLEHHVEDLCGWFNNFVEPHRVEEELSKIQRFVIQDVLYGRGLVMKSEKTTYCTRYNAMLDQIDQLAKTLDDKTDTVRCLTILTGIKMRIADLKLKEKA